MRKPFGVLLSGGQLLFFLTKRRETEKGKDYKEPRNPGEEEKEADFPFSFPLLLDSWVPYNPFRFSGRLKAVLRTVLRCPQYWGAVVFVLVLCQAAMAGAAPTPDEPPAVAPDFELPTADGQTFRLSKSGDGIRVLFFVRNDGKFVAEALAMMEQILSSSPVYEKAAVLVCIFGSAMEPAQFEALRKRFHLNWVYAKDQDNEVHRLYKIIAVPTVVLVDRSGRIAARHAGYSNAFGKQFRDDLRALLNLPPLLTAEDLSTHTRRAMRLASLGDIMAQRKIWTAALPNYKKAIELEPALRHAHLGAGFVYLQMKQPKEGVAEFQQALKIDAKSTEALVGLAWAKALEGNAAQAKAELEKLRAVAGGLAEYHDAWAAVHDSAGAKDEAKRERKTADELRAHRVNAPVSLPTNIEHPAKVSSPTPAKTPATPTLTPASTPTKTPAPASGKTPAKTPVKTPKK
jgi:tetratricopeptide (TPR) repeat protein